MTDGLISFTKNSDIEIGGREDICETIYTLSLGEKQDRQAAEEFVLDLTENDPALAKEFIQYYVNKSGGMKLAPDIFTKRYMMLGRLTVMKK